MFDAIKNKIIKRYDYFIYYQAMYTLRRMCEDNPAMAYLMQLHLDKYRELHPITPELAETTKTFFEALNENV